MPDRLKKAWSLKNWGTDFRENPNINTLAEGCLYSKTIHPGNGEKVSKNDQFIKLSYTCYDFDGNVLASSLSMRAPKELDVYSLVIALAYGMQGM